MGLYGLYSIVRVVQPVPYLSRLDGDQLQPGQSLVVRGRITGQYEESWFPFSWNMLVHVHSF